MKESIKKSLLAGLGAIDFSVEKAREAVDILVERGEITAEQGKKVVEELVERGKKDSAQLAGKVEETVKGALDKVRVIMKPKWDTLEARVAKLEEEVAKLKGSAGQE